MKINDIVQKYIALRDKKAQMKKEYEDRVAGVESLMEKVEAVLLKHFEETGSEAIKTDAGTAYKSTRTSATVADWDAVFAFIRDKEAWEMLEHRVNKKAVEEFKAANDDLPPGVNWRSEVVVNIRRS